MDKNCVNIGMCFMPNTKTHFDVRCGAVNNNKHILATGTEQGVILIWNISTPIVEDIRYRGPLKKFKKIYERKNGLELEQSYMLISNTNSVAFPVIQVEFAIGVNINGSLSENEDCSKDFQPVEFGEDILLSLHEDSTLCIWSLSSYRCLHKIRGPPFPIRSIRVLPDRRFLAIVGDTKINIIDIWNIKLIETLEITNPESTINTTSSSQHSAEEMSDMSSSPEENFSPKIITAACSMPPAVGDQDSTKSLRSVCPLIFVALTTTNEILLWDLTSSILSHKSEGPSFNGPVKVITEWDSVYEVNVPIFLKNPAKMTSHKRKRSKKHKYPTLSEYIYELEHEEGSICVLDNFVFMMVGYRILVWYYEAHELTRTAEILSFSDGNFNKSELKWFGLRCVRAEKNNLLCCWLRNGKMRMYLIPEDHSKRHFQVLRNYKYPQFRRKSENIELYYRHFSLEAEVIPLYCVRFIKGVCYGVHGSKRWKYFNNVVNFKIFRGNKRKRGKTRVFLRPKYTCIIERTGSLSRIELYPNGDLEAVDIRTFRRERMISPNVYMGVLNKLNRSWKVRQFILTEDINDHLEELRLDRSVNRGRCVDLVHCTGEHMVLVFENVVMLYSLSSLSFKFLVNSCHFFQVKSIHSICSLNGSERDLDLVELSDYFGSMDREGYMVVYNIGYILSICSKVEDSDHVKIIIDDESIYNNTQIKGQSDFDFPGEDFDISLSNCFIYLSNYRGIYRINTHCQLKNTNVDRIALDKNRDMLYVLTSTNVMTWRLRSGEMVYTYVYLSLYRQAILVSSKADYKHLKSSLTISDTLSMMLNTKSVAETSEIKMPNYSSSLSLFSEKYKRKLKCNLFISHITLSMKSNRYVKKETQIRGNIKSRSHTNCTNTHTRTEISRNTFKFLNDKCICKRVSYTKIRCTKETGKLFKGKRDYVRSGCNGHVEINCSIPVLIFPLEALLSSSDVDYLYMAKDCIFCYLGAPNGSMTIPLKYDLKENAYRMIKRRTMLMSDTPQSMSLDELETMDNVYDTLLEEPILKDLYEKEIYKHFKEKKMAFTRIENRLVRNGVGTQNTLCNRKQREAGEKNEDHLMLTRHYDLQMSSTHLVENGYIDQVSRSLSDTQLFRLNKYLSTCVFFHKSFLLQSVPDKNHELLRSVKSSRSIDREVDSSVDEVYHNLRHELDVWLLVLIMMNTESEQSFNKAYESLTSYIRSLDSEELDVYVSRALANIHVAQCFKLKGKATITQIHICHCNSTVFTFGTKCGSCHRTQSKFEYNQEIKILKNINEDSSLIILSLITLDHYLYSLKNSIRLGLKHYTIASYVVQQLMTKLLILEDNSELIKANHVQNKTTSVKFENHKNFDLKGFFLDMFSQGFGVVWNLSTFSKQSILPDQIRYTKYSLLFREDFCSTEGICMDSAYFMLYVFHYYHLLRDKAWNKLLLVSCSQNTPLAIDIIGWIVKKRKLGNKTIVSALRLIIEFMENNTELAFTHLPDLVGIVIKCLDPLDYNLRILLLKPATNALFYLVKNIPMVDFHQDTQRFAVGSQSGYIIIYDIRTATKWRMFLGKQSQIACVAFGSNGSLISAYYNQIPCFIVWKCSSSGLIGSLLSNTSKEYKSIKLKPTNVLPTLNQVSYIA